MFVFTVEYFATLCSFLLPNLHNRDKSVQFEDGFFALATKREWFAREWLREREWLWTWATVAFGLFLAQLRGYLLE